ncbi:unnamed protein product [Phytophthora fragariaefolia]|uniref:ATP-dependent DNA helicase n=1 Tax=Phytophthora fragariaefolia TaxID=1490495 RepID=A0A9W6YB55_9STRA|nr:unnamed protein product [Phytophthora fragariaefolia]
MGHYLGSLLPPVDPLTNQPEPAKFAQIYIVDPDMQQRAEWRRGIFADLYPGTLLDIEQMLTEVNPFAQQFLNFAERLRQDQAEGKDVVDMVYRRATGGSVLRFQDALLSETTVELGEGEVLLSEYNRDTGTLQHPDQPRRRFGHFLNLDQIGKRVVLPSTHPGGPRHMFKSYQDAMAVVREFGKPDVFVTMTCSPTWDEIQEKIPDENQSAQDCPDIVARVHPMKLAALLKDLDEGVHGRVQARIYVVGFQKRGLPHAHILAILAEEDTPRTREIIDKLVSAELPDPETNPQLYETILTCMMHGQCGAANPSCACMKDGKCPKGYPKLLAEVTQGNVNGFPVCIRRRRPPGVLKFRGREYDNATINQWVVPYNPYLSQKYNCHINVEVCTTLTAVKYLYKYVYKGSDKAVITIETVRGEFRQARTEPNEILRYLNARYISPLLSSGCHTNCQLFTTILVYSQVAEVRQLWERFYDDLSQDFAHRYRALLGQEKEDMIKFKTLKSLNDLLHISGYAVADFDLPQLHDFPALVLDSLMSNNLIRRELEGYDQNTLQAIVDQEDELNEGQRAIFDEIIQAANDPDQFNKLFFINGPGGTGKSTLLRHILAKVRLAGKIAIAVASSGIASLLLREVVQRI